jgi:aldose 1-epimerase
LKNDQEFLSTSFYGKTLKNETVEKVKLFNSLGTRVHYIDYGCTILGIEIKDKSGHFKNIVLNLPDLSSYLRTNRRFAAIMGRYAGRIDGGKYTLNGESYELPTNSTGVALHSDPQGFDRRVWQRKDFVKKHSMGSVYSLFSPQGDQGHPGNLKVSVTYELMKNKNEFRIYYEASTDKATHVSLTNHAFFNLAGAGSKGLNSHSFQIKADAYLEMNDRKIPSGRVLPVQDTPLDFRRSKGISTFLNQPSSILGNPPEYDHTLSISQYSGKLKVVAKVKELESSRSMTIKTTEPGVQFFSGNGFNKTEVGGEGVAYDKFDGFALETFKFPDSPNHSHFPSSLITPEKPLKSKTFFLFDVE